VKGLQVLVESMKSVEDSRYWELYVYFMLNGMRKQNRKLY